jgi:hypothetical protein
LAIPIHQTMGLRRAGLALAGAHRFAWMLHRQKEGAAGCIEAGAAQFTVHRADGEAACLSGLGP